MVTVDKNCTEIKLIGKYQWVRSNVRACVTIKNNHFENISFYVFGWGYRLLIHLIWVALDGPPHRQDYYFLFWQREISKSGSLSYIFIFLFLSYISILFLSCFYTIFSICPITLSYIPYLWRQHGIFEFHICK